MGRLIVFLVAVLVFLTVPIPVVSGLCILVVYAAAHGPESVSRKRVRA